MKKLAAYYLFLLYAASVCKPLSIWFADVLAHSYASHQHLNVVHHNEGKDHVHDQMGKAAKDDAPEQKTTTPKSGDEVTITAFVEKLSLNDFTLAPKRYFTRKASLHDVFLPLAAPPPWGRSLSSLS